MVLSKSLPEQIPHLNRIRFPANYLSRDLNPCIPNTHSGKPALGRTVTGIRQNPDRDRGEFTKIYPEKRPSVPYRGAITVPYSL